MLVRGVEIVTYGYHWSLILKVTTYFLSVRTGFREASKGGLWEIPPRSRLAVWFSPPVPATACDVVFSGPADIIVYGVVGRKEVECVPVGVPPGVYRWRVDVAALI